ncbi:hypothetical protein Sjap_007547 [Stephania japonica]|uniref:Uncharacterized protein n=1 Tax=Stephania japonica TaxID=461633 RepID=A0AAP0JPI1_9MAGN
MPSHCNFDSFSAATMSHPILISHEMLSQIQERENVNSTGEDEKTAPSASKMVVQSRKGSLSKVNKEKKVALVV